MRVLSALIVGFVLTCCFGCGGGPTLYPVTGVVMMDGQPLSACTVMFSPKSDGVGGPAVAVTAEDGTFALQTTAGIRMGTGALAGDYSVTFSKMEQRWDGRSYYVDSNQERVEDVRAHQTLPTAYTNATTTPFSANVSRNDVHFTFELKSNP